MAYVNLFTRPRRFGKTLNMSMQKNFFETGSDSTLFDGLKISGEKELCRRYMGKFPVIAISFKSASGDTFEKARKKLRSVIGSEALRFSFLAESDRLTATERRQYSKLIELNDNGEFAMSDDLLENSLLMLSSFLHKYYGQKTIILIDEYDVPLDKAYQSGYYDIMTEFIRTFLGQALKTNDSLYFAVLTGCLRISKESIFTGLNNFSVYTIKDVQYNEYFGFSDMEVPSLLEYYGFTGKYDTIREWFEAETRKDMPSLERFCRAFEENDTAAIEKGFTSYLRKTISIRKNFYHGILLGLFAGMNGWKVRSNAESGEGYSDISIEVEEKEIGIIIEFKYAEQAAFDQGCREALKQIHDRKYEEALIDDGMTTR